VRDERCRSPRRRHGLAPSPVDVPGSPALSAKASRRLGGERHRALPSAAICRSTNCSDGPTACQRRWLRSCPTTSTNLPTGGHRGENRRRGVLRASRARLSSGRLQLGPGQSSGEDPHRRWAGGYRRDRHQPVGCQSDDRGTGHSHHGARAQGDPDGGRPAGRRGSVGADVCRLSDDGAPRARYLRHGCLGHGAVGPAWQD